MAGKRNYEEIKELIEKADSYKDRRVVPAWEENLANLNMDLSYSDEIQYGLNVAHSTLEVLTTSVYEKDPSFSFNILADLNKEINEIIQKATGLTTDIKIIKGKLEKIIEKIVKIYFKEMRSRNTNKRCIKDAGWAGFGVTKMGYCLDVDGELKALRQKNKKEYVRIAESGDLNELVTKDEPYKVRINPMDIIIPHDASSLYELPWVCQVVYMGKDEAYDVYGKVLPLSASSEPEKDSEFTENMVKIYEFHSLSSGDPYIYTLAEGYSGFVKAIEHPLYDKKTKKVKSLFQFLWFNDGVDTPWPVADLSLVNNQIREANIAITRRVELHKRLTAQYIATGSWEPEEIKKIENGKDGAVVVTFSPDAKLEQLPLLSLGAEFYNNIAMIKQEILETLGLTDYAIGGATQNRKATEAQLMNMGMSNRIRNRIAAIDDFVFAQADCFVEIMKVFKETVREFTLLLDADERIVFELSGALLKTTDMQVQVIPGSTVDLDMNDRLRKATQLAQIAVGFVGVANLQEVWKVILEDLGYGADKDKLTLNYQPDQQVGTAPAGSPPKISGLTTTIGQPSPSPVNQSMLASEIQGL